MIRGLRELEKNRRRDSVKKKELVREERNRDTQLERKREQ